MQQAIAAANQIIGRPYVYGGGHKSFLSRGYDCSGTVSFALHGGALLDNPLDSSSVHPEAYPLVQKILQELGRDIKQVIGDSGVLRKLTPHPPMAADAVPSLFSSCW